MFLFGGRVPAIAGSHNSMREYWLTYDDYLSIKNEARNIRNVAPILNRGDIRIVSEHASSGGQVTGVTPNFNEIRYLPMGIGRWLNDLDNEHKRNVAIIGDETVKNLFPGYPALGSTILLNGRRFEVVGILSKIGQGDNNSSNSRVFIPYQTMASMFPMTAENAPPNAISFINYQPRIRGQHLVAKAEVRKLIARNHGFDYTINEAFQDWDTIESEKTVGKIFSAMNMFLGSVGIVTLFLGAIGIINIMLVSVSERTKEIGLRKALGATNRNVLIQFFLEGAFLTLLSGGVGIGFAAGLMAALGTLPSPPGFDPPKLVASSALLAVGCLSLAGIAAGLLPARKAAMLTPVEALRAE
jgi:putative ABC transport system permease protein